MGYLFYVEFNFNSYFLDYALGFEKSFFWPTSLSEVALFYVSSIAFDPLLLKYFIVKNIASIIDLICLPVFLDESG